MADTPAPQAAPSRAGGPAFNLRNPGAKEYLIVGIIALALGYWYFKKKQSSTSASQQAASTAAQPTTTTTTSTGQLSGTGGGMPFQSWLNNQAGSATTGTSSTTGTTSTGTSSSTGTTTTTTPSASNVQSLVGLPLSQATSLLSAAGIGNTVYLSGNPNYIPNAQAVQPYLNQDVVAITQDSPSHVNITVTAPA